MSSSTALLPKNRKDDHPIFLRVCHSPWAFINQQTLATIRGVIAAYMTVMFGVIIFYDAYFSKHGWQIPFELPNIIYLHQVLYFWMACVSTTSTCTLMTMLSTYFTDVDSYAPLLPPSWQRCPLGCHHDAEDLLSPATEPIDQQQAVLQHLLHGCRDVPICRHSGLLSDPCPSQ
jgi:hypothetical protein